MLQLTIAPGVLYCQNGEGEFIGIDFGLGEIANQDCMGIQGGNGINAKLKMRQLDVGVDIAGTAVNNVIEVDAQYDARLFAGAGAHDGTNRLSANLPGLGWGLPRTSGPVSFDTSMSVFKDVAMFGFGHDTVGTIKPAGGWSSVSNDSNWVDTQLEFYARRADALTRIVTLMGVGDPNGMVSAPVGSLYTRCDGGPGSTLYAKESGDNDNSG